jgi:hypothetical protein
LIKRDILRLPDPFAVVTVDGEQTQTSSCIKKVGPECSRGKALLTRSVAADTEPLLERVRRTARTPGMLLTCRPLQNI